MKNRKNLNLRGERFIGIGSMFLKKRQQNDYGEDRNRKDSSEEGEEGKITFVTDLDVEGGGGGKLKKGSRSVENEKRERF